ncbi:M24 family metallopeptidase, partial [Streptococcus suis]
NNIYNNALLLFDLGVETLCYTSYMTRTFSVCKTDQFKKDIYNLNLEAHMAAVNKIKPGVTAGEIDYAARSVIEKAG